MYDIVKRNYDRGLWSKAQVKVCVKKDVITAEQYQAITGEVYA